MRIFELYSDYILSWSVFELGFCKCLNFFLTIKPVCKS